jgi:hypothetical protein
MKGGPIWGMPQEYKDDQAHDYHFNQQFMLQRVDGTFDQLRAVIDRNNLKSRRERRRDFLYFLFHAIDDI